MAERWGGRRAQAVTRLVVERDGGVCHLCLLPGADSTDHLEPTSLGGSVWDMANMAAAHYSPCNASRHNRPLTPQLLASFRTASWHARVLGRSPVDATALFDGW